MLNRYINLKWIGAVTLAFVAILSIGWIFRAELVLFGVAQLKSAVTEVGPTIDIEWSTGTDSQGRAPADRPPNIVLIVADDMGWNNISMNGPNPTRFRAGHRHAQRYDGPAIATAFVH